MKSDRGRKHGEDVDDNLLEGVEEVQIDRIETSLSVGATSEEKSIDIVDVAAPNGINENRGDNGSSDDPEI
jgi:hypothetical protein